MIFRVGQKVEYVGGYVPIMERLRRAFHPYRSPDKGVPYTVINAYISHSGEQVIELLEFPSPGDAYWGAGFIADSFRPLVERKTSIEIFTAMLKPQQVDA